LLKLEKNILKKNRWQKVVGGEIKFRLEKCLIKIEIRVSREEAKNKIGVCQKPYKKRVLEFSERHKIETERR